MGPIGRNAGDKNARAMPKKKASMNMGIALVGNVRAYKSRPIEHTASPPSAMRATCLRLK
ncbi:unannotated protein [freshwater metagenome]|uniref:Unannotated protein n=1 Tax=freshwater metagenome TaxID=449393 RepID=A0A6J6NKN8_9ZZZZ